MTNNQLVKMLESFGEGERQDYNHLNQYVKSPIRVINVMERLNDLNHLYRSLRACKWLKTIIRTKSGSISKTIMNLCSWDIKKIITKSNVFKGIIITVILNGLTYVIKVGHLQANKDNTSTGIKSFKRFADECERQGLDLTKYMTTKEEGLINKSKIEPPMIINYKQGCEYDHVYHLDFHKAWPSAMCEAFPEFEPICMSLSSKYILNPALGYMQSSYIQYILAQLPLEGINRTNKKILDICAKMALEGIEILGINTDGVWYRSEKGPYHDENEGEDLHKWSTDIHDVRWYAASHGQYYYIDNGKVIIKARGYYEYEKIKPRDKWNTVDDFFKAIESYYVLSWDDEEGFITNYEDK